MLFKIMVVVVLVIILYSLGSALFHLVRHKDRSSKVVKALTWRIGLSLFLFLLLFLAYAMGWITPHGL